MRKRKPALSIADNAILIGYDLDGACVYSAIMSLNDYYDSEHLWDSSDSVKALSLHKVHGYIFSSRGELEQEFESTFDVKTGVYAKGWAKHSDGTYRED